MSNMKEAKEFEQDMLRILGQNGFWASAFPKADDGSQPADIIALNHKGRYLIDAKVCDKGRFPLSRIEENQEHSMVGFRMKCDGAGWFALKYPNNKIYMLPLPYLQLKREEGVKSITDIEDIFELEYWLYGAKD